MRKPDAQFPPRTNPDIDYPKYLAMMEVWDLPKSGKIAIIDDFWYLVGSALDRELLGQKQEYEAA